MLSQPNLPGQKETWPEGLTICLGCGTLSEVSDSLKILFKMVMWTAVSWTAGNGPEVSAQKVLTICACCTCTVSHPPEAHFCFFKCLQGPGGSPEVKTEGRTAREAPAQRSDWARVALLRDASACLPACRVSLLSSSPVQSFALLLFVFVIHSFMQN